MWNFCYSTVHTLVLGCAVSSQSSDHRALNDSKSIMDGECLSSEEEENSAADMFLTSTGSYDSHRGVQPASSNDSLGCDSPVEPSSRVDERVPSGLIRTSARETFADCVGGIQDGCSSKKVTKLSMKSDGRPEIPNSSDLLDGTCETSSVLQDGEPEFEVENKLEQKEHEQFEPVGESIVSPRKSKSQNELSNETHERIEFMREKIRRYRPGDGLVEVGGVGRLGFAVPKMTTLLLVGPSGAGKSTLINNLIRVLEKRTSGFDRAQVYEQKGEGSLFLQEYVFFEGAKHFSVFDSRGFSDKSIEEDLVLVRQWMTDGICHGEPVCRPSDNNLLKEELEGRGRQGHAHLSTKRSVDFVIFVLNAVTVHEMRESHDMTAIDNLVMLYKSPFLSFKDDRPVVVMTHGDKLSQKDRILTRTYVGKIFGVSPLDQVFDISCLTENSVNPGDEDPLNDVVLLNMLDFALQRADRNFPYKNPVTSLVEKAYMRIMGQWNDLDHGLKTVLIGILVTWLFCLVLFLAAKGVVHHRHPWALPKTLGKHILKKAHKKKFLLKYFKKPSWH